MLWKTQIRIEIKCFEGLILKRDQKYNKEVLGKYKWGKERVEISLYGFSYGQDTHHQMNKKLYPGQLLDPTVKISLI